MKRLVHVGVGPLGQRILSEIIDRDAAHLVAAVDVDPGLVGKPLASLVPKADPKLRILPSLDAIEDWSTIDVAVVATSSDLAKCAPTLRTLLSHGVAIVSTCEELIYPWLRHVALAEDLDTLAKRHGGRVLGTGVNPGYLMDALPAMLTCVSRSVRSIRVQRVQDASVRRVPFQKKIGAGLDDDAFNAKVRDGSLRHVGLGESLHFLAHYVGLTIERWDEDLRMVRADRDLSCALGPIPKGRAAGVRQTARGFHDEACVIELDFIAAIGQSESYDRIVIEGEPPLDMKLAGGVHGDVATSAIVVNSIARIIAAPPGLHTMATIPPPVHTPGT